MKTQVTFAAVAVLAAAALAAAMPASATPGSLTEFANSDATTVSYNHSTGMLSAAGSVNFVYTDDLSVLGDLSANISLTGASSGHAFTASAPNGEDIVQELSTGSFTITYTGADRQYDNLFLCSNTSGICAGKSVTVLLAGSFNGGDITVTNLGHSPDINIDTGSTGDNTGSLSYTSSLETFVGSPTEEILDLNASSINGGSAFTYTANQYLKGFTGKFTGTYSANPAPTNAVPEPASWALMLLGVGSVGGMMRRRVAIARA